MSAVPSKKRRWKRGGKAGAPPGTIVTDPQAVAPVIRAFGYGPEDLVEQEVKDLDSLRSLMGKWPVVWVNIDGLGDVDHFHGRHRPGAA